MGSAAPHVGQLKFDPLGAIEHGNAFAQPFPRVINRQTTLIPPGPRTFSHSLIFQPLPCRSADPCKLHRIQESRYCKGERGENGVHVQGTELDKKVDPRLREITLRGQGRKETGFTHPCTLSTAYRDGQ